MLRRAAATAAIAVGLMHAPARLPAQSFDPQSLVLLALNAAPQEPGLAIYFRPGVYPEVVLAVPPGTTAEQLAGAFTLLDHAQKDFKKENKQSEPNSFMRIRVPASATRRSLGNKEREVYTGYLASLVDASPIAVSGIGSGRAITISMPKWPDKEKKTSS